MSELIAIDTNIILYAFNDADLVKKGISIDIIRSFPVISSQLLSETTLHEKNRIDRRAIAQ